MNLSSKGETSYRRETNKELLKVEPDELELLAWAVPNEIINGFKVDEFDRKLSVIRNQVREIAMKLRSLPASSNLTLDLHDATILRNALAVVIKELGESEFQTRTGFDLGFGQHLIEKLNRFSQQAVIKV